jgi:hypothetical protein
MNAHLSTRPLTLRQTVTLDRLYAQHAGAKVVGWVFSGPLVRLNSGRHVYIPPDGIPLRVPPTILYPEELDKNS